ncbi:MAG: hypothetical protein ACRDRX_04315 [Pseudonocardiaceae bacterium]
MSSVANASNAACAPDRARELERAVLRGTLTGEQRNAVRELVAKVGVWGPDAHGALAVIACERIHAAYAALLDAVVPPERAEAEECAAAEAAALGE